MSVRSSPFGSIHINTGSSALFYGLLAALATVALVIGIAGFDLTRPADYPLSPKLHGQADQTSRFQENRLN